MSVLTPGGKHLKIKITGCRHVILFPLDKKSLFPTMKPIMKLNHAPHLHEILTRPSGVFFATLNPMHSPDYRLQMRRGASSNHHLTQPITRTTKQDHLVTYFNHLHSEHGFLNTTYCDRSYVKDLHYSVSRAPYPINYIIALLSGVLTSDCTTTGFSSNSHLLIFREFSQIVITEQSESHESKAVS